MKRCQSLENLPMLPEEVKVAVSLLRLTLSDKQETATESEFQSYMTKHSHFPYHKAVPFTMTRQKLEPEVPVNDSVTRNPDPRVKTGQQIRGKRVLRRRCESSPSAISVDDDNKDTRVIESQTGYSQSAPVEGRGFFHRLFSYFLRKRPTTPTPEINNNEQEETTTYPNVVSNPIPIKGKSPNSAETGHFVRVFTKSSGNNNMGNLIFMSMR